MTARIDVLMATYNSEKFLAEQIDSILTQNYSNLHLIIKDDGSSDSTSSIIQQKMDQYPEKITFIPSEINRGAIATFSDLMQCSQANYVMFADHDDVWLPEKVAKTFFKMERMEWEYGADMPLLVHTDLSVVDAHLHPIHPSFWGYIKLDPEKGKTLNRLLVQNVISGCTVMINRELIELAAPIPDGVIMHDWWLGLIAASMGQVEYLEESTILYRQHQTNQVGAQQANLLKEMGFFLSHPLKYMANVQKTTERQKHQAALLSKRFSKNLDYNQLTLVHAFSKFREAGFFGKLYLMLRYDFYKQGFFRNLRDLSFN